jgi:hypothetical protein
MSETLSVIFDGEVFRPEVPVKLKPNTRYQITLQGELQSDNSAASLTSKLQDYYFNSDNKHLQNFLMDNIPLVEFLVDAARSIRHYLPEAELELKLAPAEEPGEEDKLLVIIHTRGQENEVLSNFNRLKAEWWFEAAENFLDKLSLEVEHPAFSTNQAITNLTNLIGSVEAPSDWSLEHDHYLYGTPKRNHSQNNV